MATAINLQPGARKQRVLFLCTGNSCRSQMAEGLLRELLGDRYEALSAGTHPVAINPRAIQVMSELGYDLNRHKSQALDEFSGETIDYVISVCDAASQLCPDFPGSKRIHWSIPDPADAKGKEAEVLDCFRWTRDHLKERILDTFGQGEAPEPGLVIATRP